MNEPKMIKIITPSRCPHCGKDVIVSSKMVSPVVDWILRKEDVNKAKDNLKQQVEKMKFKDENEKKMILSWINSEDTLFGPDEVPQIVEQLREKTSDSTDKKNATKTN